MNNPQSVAKQPLNSDSFARFKKSFFFILSEKSPKISNYSLGRMNPYFLSS